jgi:hypothetical protein
MEDQFQVESIDSDLEAAAEEMLMAQPAKRKLVVDMVPSAPAKPALGIADKMRASRAVSAEQPKAEGFLLGKMKEAAHLSKVAKKNLPATSKGPKQQLSFNLMKPSRNKFSRVHPSEEYSMLGVPVIEDPDNQGKWYFVMPGVKENLDDFVQESIKLIDIYAATDHVGNQFVWYVKQSETDWYGAATKAVKRARKGWVAVKALMGASTYEVRPPVTTIPEPDWSSFPTWDEMIESAFDGKMILGPTDDVIRKLAGDVSVYEEDDEQ